MHTYKTALIQTTAYRHLRDHVDSILSDFNISTTEWIILGHLNSHDNQRLSELASILQVEQSRITVLVDKLVEKNYVIRSRDKKDRRSISISLTKRGKNTIPSIEKELKEHIYELLEGLSQQDLEAYFRVLNQIVKNSNLISNSKNEGR